MTNTLNDTSLSLIKSFESCRLDAYQDVKGVWTQGFGHTQGITENSPDINQEQADVWLEQDLRDAEDAIAAHIDVNLTDNQFGALVSLVFNVGTGCLEGHVGEYINAGQISQAADAFLQWDHCNGIVVQGLTNRRTAERELFLTP